VARCRERFSLTIRATSAHAAFGRTLRSLLARHPRGTGRRRRPGAFRRSAAGWTAGNWRKSWRRRLADRAGRQGDFFDTPISRWQATARLSVDVSSCPT
jgi:hypothetical protein